MKHYVALLKSVFISIYFFTAMLHAYGPGNTTSFSPQLTNGIEGSQSSAYNQQNNEYLFSWLSGTSQIYYVICDDTGAQVTSQSNFSGSSSSSPSVAYNSVNNHYLITWIASSPSFGIVDDAGNIIVAPTSIFISPGLLLNGNTFCCYNSVNNQYCITWTAQDTVSSISSTYFAIVNADGTIAQGETAIPAVSGQVTSDFTDSFVTYNSQDNQYLFTWVSLQVAPGIGNTAFAIYDADGAQAIAATVIPQTDSFVTSSYPIFTCYNSINNQYFFTWCAYNGSITAVFAIYSKSGVELVPPTEIASFSSFVIPICSYNVRNNQYFISLNNNNTQAVCWIFDSNGNVISSDIQLPLLLGNAPVGFVFNSFNPQDDQYFITWYSSGGTCAYFNIFTASPLPAAPTNLQGTNGTNKFLTFVDYITQLTWVSSTSTNIASYNVYRNGSLIATLPAYATSYIAHNKPPTLTTYSVQAVSTSGDASIPASITL